MTDAVSSQEKPKVIIARCDEYNPGRIAEIIGKGMDELGIVPSGRTLIKPNTVIAHKFFFPHAYTRPEFLDGLLAATKARGTEIRELAVGERCGITVPTRFAFSQAGYKPVIRKHRVKRYHFDECFQVERKFDHPGRLRDYIYVPQPIDECDFLISAPKLKSHPWTRITIALKNFIGLQTDRHRLVDHDYMLETKIADLQEVIKPGFIAVDAIEAGEMKMLTPIPYPMGLILMGVNPVAVDAAACHIIGFDPRRVDHVRVCHERGYGPVDLEEIQLAGDVSLEEARKKAAGFRVPTVKVDEEFNDKSNITAYVGKPPDPERMEYCWGGCPGSLIEAIEVIKQMQPKVRSEVKRLHFVFGAYEGQIKAEPGERVILCGDCAAYRGTVCDRKVELDSEYKSRDKMDPRHARAKGLIARMLFFVLYFIRNRKRQVLRAKGCPASVAENILFLWGAGRTKNPYLDYRIVVPFLFFLMVSKLANLVRILFRRRPKKPCA